MKKLLIIACMMHAKFLSNSCAVNAQISENILAQKSEYEFLKHSIENYDIFVIALNRYENDENYQQLSQTQLNIVFEKISEKIAEFRRENPDKYIFVLFSESFFGSDPLTNVQSIVDKCKSLSNQRRVVIQASFLHRFNVEHAPPWLQNYKPITKTKRIAQRITRDKKEARKFLIANKWHPDRIANYTLTFCFGKILSIYRKSTHCQAAWKLIIPGRGKRPKCAYEFGDFKDHRLYNFPIADLFCGENPLIATRMCSDMNDPHLSPETKLVIVHAHDHPTDQSHYENLKIPILFVDEKGISVMRPSENFAKNSGEITNKLINIKWRINGDFINWRSRFQCFPFDLSKIMEASDNDKLKILDYIPYDLY